MNEQLHTQEHPSSVGILLDRLMSFSLMSFWSVGSIRVDVKVLRLGDYCDIKILHTFTPTHKLTCISKSSDYRVQYSEGQ